MLRKVANRLVRAGVLASELGRSGGVSLAKPDLSVYDVLAAAGEDLSVTACTHDGECARSGSCGIEPIMIQLQRGMEAMLRLQRISAR